VWAVWSQNSRYVCCCVISRRCERRQTAFISFQSREINPVISNRRSSLHLPMKTERMNSPVSQLLNVVRTDIRIPRDKRPYRIAVTDAIQAFSFNKSRGVDIHRVNKEWWMCIAFKLLQSNTGKGSYRLKGMLRIGSHDLQAYSRIFILIFFRDTMLNLIFNRSIALYHLNWTKTGRKRKRTSITTTKQQQ